MKILVIGVDPQSYCTHSLFEKFNIQTADEDGNKIKNLPTIQNIYETKLVDVKKENVILNLTDHLSLKKTSEKSRDRKEHYNLDIPTLHY